MSTHLLPMSSPQPAKKLRSCLSPSRSSRSASPDALCLTGRSLSASSSDSMWPKRKCVRWEGEVGGSDVTRYFATYSACEYDRTPLAPPSEAERSCVLPARGSRCLNYDVDEDDDDEEEEDEIIYSDSETRLPRSPFATPEDSDSENCADEWSDCFARRRMMFTRLCPTRDGPQFEGFRSLSSTLVDLLRSVEGDDDDDERTASREQSDDEGDNDEGQISSSLSSSGTLIEPSTGPAAMGDLFLRLRENSADSDIGTPSLISSADSESDCYRLASPRGSAIECIPGAIPPWKVPATTNPGTYNPLEL